MPTNNSIPDAAMTAREAMRTYVELFNDPDVADKAAAATFVAAFMQNASATIAAATAQLQLDAANAQSVKPSTPNG